MVLIPKWTDDFSTDPTSDPRYRIGNQAVYNATDDRIESTSTLTSGHDIPIVLTDSKINSGIATANLYLSNVTGNNAAHVAFRAFGYTFFNGHGAPGNKFTLILPEEIETREQYFTNSFPLYEHAIEYSSGAIASSEFEVKFIASETEVLVFIDNGLRFRLPKRDVFKDMQVFLFKQGGNATDISYCSGISYNTDSSLPKSPTINEPSIAGSIKTPQEVYTQISESRLFVDLGTYSGSITGLTNVVYDPGGSAVAMTEDTGVPDGSGGTTGDFYLEIPANGVASDYRLVIKEDFVTTNSVVTTDTIDFDVTGGPASQSGSVTEDDDLQCFFSISDSPSVRPVQKSLFHDIGAEIKLHNLGADGNSNNVAQGNIYDCIDGIGVVASNTVNIYTLSSSAAFPIIVDVDLGKEYDVATVALNNGVFSDSRHHSTNCDIYSHTSPFSGAGLGQGTLRASNFPITQEIDNQNDTTLPQSRGIAIPVTGPALNIAARYWRFVIVDATNDTSAGGPLSNDLRVFSEIEFKINDPVSIDSLNDNAQFEVDTGGGFVAFPGGGVTQGSGVVKIILPASAQLDAGEQKFFSVKFKADLTD